MNKASEVFETCVAIASNFEPKNRPPKPRKTYNVPGGGKREIARRLARSQLKK